ncbi:unnamed protein product, partial [Prorocentrum cordatum]
ARAAAARGRRPPRPRPVSSFFPRLHLTVAPRGARPADRLNPGDRPRSRPTSRSPSVDRARPPSRPTSGVGSRASSRAPSRAGSVASSRDRTPSPSGLGRSGSAGSRGPEPRSWASQRSNSPGARRGIEALGGGRVPSPQATLSPYRRSAVSGQRDPSPGQRGRERTPSPGAMRQVPGSGLTTQPHQSQRPPMSLREQRG